jgi:hypothetical protein
VDRRTVNRGARPAPITESDLRVSFQKDAHGNLNIELGPKCYDCPNLYCGDTMPKLPTVRLTQPLVRGNGSHRPATWEEALDRVAAAFRKSIAKNDVRDFGMFSCSKTTNELNYAAQKFVRSVMGTNNIDSCNRT